MPYSAMPEVHDQQNEAVADDYGGRRNSAQFKDRLSPRNYLYESPSRYYPKAHAEYDTWRERNARSLDIPNRIPEIRRASLNENVKVRETLNNQVRKGKGKL